MSKSQKITLNLKSSLILNESEYEGSEDESESEGSEERI